MDDESGWTTAPLGVLLPALFPQIGRDGRRPTKHDSNLLARVAGLPLDKTTVLLDMLMSIGAIEQRPDDRLVLTDVVPELACA